MAFVIEDELKKLPASPGVYLMHDKKDEVIYVGKAVFSVKQSEKCHNTADDKSYMQI